MTTMDLPTRRDVSSVGAKNEDDRSMIGRVMLILQAFDGANELTVSKIARATGLPLATAYRVVNEMVDRGLLERDGHIFRTGIRLWELGVRGSRALALRDAALPYLEHVQAKVRSRTQLTVLDNTDVVLIEQLALNTIGRRYWRVGSRVPAQACTPGLVLGAFAARSVRAEILRSSATKRFLAPTFDQSFVRAAFDRIPTEQSATTSGQLDPLIAGVSVPIRDESDRVVAALSVMIPVERGTDGIVPLLQNAATGISRRMAKDPEAGLRPIWH